MKLQVHYEAIDPYYSSQDQTFIGIDEDSCWEQKREFEEWLGRNHPNGIRSIYKVSVAGEEQPASAQANRTSRIK